MGTRLVFGMACTRYAHIQNIGKPNYLKVFGVGKSKGIKRIANIAKCRTCSEKSTLVACPLWFSPKAMFSCLFQQLYVRGFDVLLVICACSLWPGLQHALTIRITWRVCSMINELLTVHEHLCTSPVVGGVLVVHYFSFQCFVFVSLSCVMCTQCCQFIWIVHSWLPLQSCLTFF